MIPRLSRLQNDSRLLVCTSPRESKRYVPLYLAEFQFRHNNRKNPDNALVELLLAVTNRAPLECGDSGVSNYGEEGGDFNSKLPLIAAFLTGAIGPFLGSWGSWILEVGGELGAPVVTLSLAVPWLSALFFMCVVSSGFFLGSPASSPMLPPVCGELLICVENQ